ncbi:MAG: hypothetical protein IJ189_11415 [Clostridia bacterium]|nr:hypothetical protein [Clostridia bacterium]
MVRRFLTYSLKHNRPVKVLFADTMKYKNITVVLLEGDTVGYLTAGRKKPLTTAVDNLLSASYARGDDGNTLQYVRENKEEPV